ncbi:hypothetical protein BTW00_12645 [Psychrobacter sp. C 20.9]|uniref:hypothetical protein n=1 Tax=Psychrobacter sp. C 20.9 TaxID=1926477 RepID=UPI00094712A7|nr:hypothetical protein [Psychrobacter sp. C 20.9]OLF34612.1 hypothetical protein BTW00_12645 [Psychrobacter sp. C 20.9]
MKNSEVLDSDGSVRFPKRTMWISFLILLAMGAMISLWFSFSETNDWSNISLGDIGAILSGTFTALAWYWFIEAYLLQSKELALQRKTLETQVEELKHSVRAQQGSEQALHIQSNALTRQLSITEKQFTDYQEEKKRSVPNFILIDTPYHTVQAYDEKTGSSYQDEEFLKLSSTTNLNSVTFDCYIAFKNIGAECKISHIDVSDLSISNSSMDFDHKLFFKIDSSNNTIAHINITLNILAKDSSTLEIGDLYILYRKPEMVFNLELFYSQDKLSSSDSYRLSINEQEYNLTKKNED